MTGDQADMRARLKALLPPWFGDSNPVLNGILSGAAAALAIVYSFYAYAKLQTRLLTATGPWLDVAAFDFFGTAVKRGYNESDSTFRLAILANLFRPRATRKAIGDILYSLTGYRPRIIEPWQPADCGAYGIGYACYGGAGAYGSVLLPAQAFLVAKRPRQPGIANVAGYGASAAGYGRGSQAEYASLAMVMTRVTDATIYAAIDAARAAGVTIWTRIENPVQPDAITVNGSPFTFDGEQVTFN